MSIAPKHAPEDISDKPLDPEHAKAEHCGDDVPNMPRTKMRSPGQGNPAILHSDKQKGKSNGASVFVYLAILFAAAFFMLLLAYFMQQRNNEEAMDGLRDSISQFQSLDELQEENKALYEENQALREELATLESKYAEQQTELEDAENTIHELRNNTGIVDLLVLETALREEQYADAATVCLVIQKRDLSYYDGVTYVASYYSSTRVNPMQRFQEISEQLIALGYLEQDLDSGLLTLTQLALDNGAIEVGGFQSTQG